MRVTLLLFSVLFSFTSIAQPIIQWDKDLKITEDVKFLRSDSSQLNANLYLSRRIILDSLNDVAKEKKISFHDRTYLAKFDNPAKISQVLIYSSNPVFGLIIYIKAYDEKGKPHLIYDQRNSALCQEKDEQVLLVSIPPTLFNVVKIEVGALIHNSFIKAIGISDEVDGNKVIRELALQGLQNVCVKSSFVTEKQNLGLAINSTFDEVKPVISPDGRTLFFGRQNHPDNTRGKKDDQDIYFSQTKNGKIWTFAKNLGAPLNNKNANGICSVSPDGNSLLLLNHYLPNNRVDQGTSGSSNKIDGWTFPKPANIEDFENLSPYADFCMSVTQKEMLMAIENDEGEGDQDLFASFYQETTGTWSKPKNLGITINTMLNEYAPFLAADGVTLYFASEGHLGYGGADLFVTRRLDQSWQNWSEPENLGPIINSGGDDSYYTVPASGSHAYFVSNTSIGGKDIFRIPLPRQFKPSPVAMLSGKLINMETGNPEEVEINVYKENSKIIIGKANSNPVTGDYKVALTAGQVYVIDFTKNGQSLKTTKIDCRYLLDFKEIIQNFYISPDNNLNFQISDIRFSEKEEEQPTQSLERVPVLIHGKVFTSTARPLEANLNFEALDASEKVEIYSNPKTGIFKSILEAGKIYKTRVTFGDYQTTDTVDFSATTYYTEESRFYIFGDSLPEKTIPLGYKYHANLKPTEKKAIIKQKKKDFKYYKAFGSTHTNIPREVMDDLEHFAEFLKAAPEYSIELLSYSDSRGNDEQLLFETEERARICSEFLKASGIADKRISYKGYGNANPIAGNFFKSGRSKNLRVEVLLKKVKE